MDASAAKKVAICDDNDDILEMLKMVLGHAGYRAESAHGHMELIPLLKTFAPDLLILDIRMPEMDGFDVLESIQEKGFRIPVFLVTAHDHFMYRNYAPVAGVREYLVKPIDPKLLLEKVKEVLG